MISRGIELKRKELEKKKMELNQIKKELQKIGAESILKRELTSTLIANIMGIFKMYFIWMGSTHLSRLNCSLASKKQTSSPNSHSSMLGTRLNRRWK